MKHAFTAADAALLCRAAAAGLLLTAGVAVAQPPPPSFAGHHDMRSREPDASALSYSWRCGTIQRSVTFRLSYRQTTDSKGNPDVAAAWGIGEYMRGDQTVDPGDAGLSAFVSSLGAIAFVAGRCFDDEGELRISGLVAGSHATETRVFRVR